MNEKSKLKQTMDILLSISIITLAIVFLYNTYGRPRINIEVNTDCQGNIQNITGYNTTPEQNQQIQQIIKKNIATQQNDIPNTKLGT